MRQDREALSARDGDVETVIVEEEIDTAWRLLTRRARHGVEHDRRLLALEAVDGSDANAVRHGLANAAHRQVICARLTATSGRSLGSGWAAAPNFDAARPSRKPPWRAKTAPFAGTSSMEPTGIEPVTSCLQSRRSPS